MYSPRSDRPSVVQIIVTPVTNTTNTTITYLSVCGKTTMQNECVLLLSSFADFSAFQFLERQVMTKSGKTKENQQQMITLTKTKKNKLDSVG